MQLAESNRAVVHQFFESAFNRRTPSILQTHFSDIAARQVKDSLDRCLPLSACADLTVWLEDTVADDQKVACRVRWRGTRTHEAIGAAPAGRTLSGSTTELFQFANGKIVECTQNWADWARNQLLDCKNGVRSLEPTLENLREPVLEIADIQGHLLIGFDSNHQALLFLEITDVAASKSWLGAVASRITTAEQLLARNRQAEGMPAEPTTRLGIGFSFAGLCKLTAEAAEFFDEPFKQGMHARSRLLGDPIEAGATGNPEGWLVGGPHNIPDVLLIIADDDQEVTARELARIEADLRPGFRVIHRVSGAQLGEHPHRREHFGFRDPVSQPALRGRLSGKPGDFLTPRRNPANRHEGKPGQRLIWPGEFVFGYPGQDAMDLVWPGLASNAGPKWGKNGSFLVFRRLRQDVAAFREFLAATAADLSRRFPHIGQVTPQWLGAKLVGRWASGAPLLRATSHDIPELGGNEHVSNDFRYLEPGRAGCTAPPPDAFADAPQSSSDLLGLVCPQAAHIRKAYPRDHATPSDIVASIETHRLLRRGVPFGKPFGSPGERGLLFIAYQTSIERQFEFVTRAWLNNPRLREEGDGHDPLVGQSMYRAGTRMRQFVLPLPGSNGAVERITIDLPVEWITPTGGGYFFVPGLSGLQHLTRP
jgi:Dyp-type peroxidase family